MIRRHTAGRPEPRTTMTRHLILALGLALVAAATALLLADVGVFESPARWLFDAYRGEALWKAEPGPVWPWLPMLTAGLGALLVAWVAVDLASWTAKLAVLATTLGAVAFLSLTLAFYGLAYNPWPALAAATLAFAMGSLLAETPTSRNRRDSQMILGPRAGTDTLQAWLTSGLTPPWPDPSIREGAVLAVRSLAAPPTAETVAAHLLHHSRLLAEISRLLRRRPGVVLDLPAGDGVRAFFGFRPEAAGGDLDAAAEAALELATFFREDATLQGQVGQPAIGWGIGMSVGPLVTGRHGPEPDTLWTVSGPTAEQARQLAALNARHRTSILVGRRAAETLAARFELQAVEGEAIHSLIARRPSPAHEELPLSAADADLPVAPPKPVPAPDDRTIES